MSLAILVLFQKRLLASFSMGQKQWNASACAYNKEKSTEELTVTWLK